MPKTPVTPEGVFAAFPNRPKIADRRGERCAVASNAVYALCNRLERRMP